MVPKPIYTWPKRGLEFNKDNRIVSWRIFDLRIIVQKVGIFYIYVVLQCIPKSYKNDNILENLNAYKFPKRDKSCCSGGRWTSCGQLHKLTRIFYCAVLSKFLFRLIGLYFVLRAIYILMSLIISLIFI